MGYSTGDGGNRWFNNETRSAWIMGICAIIGGIMGGAWVVLTQFGPRPTVVNQPAAPAPAITTQTIPVPTQSRQPQEIVTHMATLTMPGNQSNGYRYTVPRTGLYRFTYVDGAYSIYKPGTEPPNQNIWLTSVFVYKNMNVPYDGQYLHKNSAILAIVDYVYSKTKEEAMATARADTRDYSADLRAGDVLRLVGVDARDYFSENLGSVTINVSLVTYT